MSVARLTAHRSTAIALLCAATLVLCAGLAVAAAPSSSTSPGESAQRVRFHLAWAPDAQGKSSPSRPSQCEDPAARDTLYLTFEPQQAESTFLGVQGELYVYAAPGDTLGEVWQMEKGGSNRGGAVVEFGPAESFEQTLPLAGLGAGLASYDRTPASGRLRFVYSQSATSPVSLQAGRTYAAARIIFLRTKPELRGCEAPVCIEWRRATFFFGPDDKVDLQYGESRWVARGGDSQVCRSRVASWRPKVSKGEPDVIVPTKPADLR